MKGTEARLPTQSIGPGPLLIGQREFELREFTGHTDSGQTFGGKADLLWWGCSRSMCGVRRSTFDVQRAACGAKATKAVGQPPP